MIIERRRSYGGFETRELVVEGSGPEAVFLHGFADSCDTWRRVLAELERRGRAGRAVDLPGYGQADPTPAGPAIAELDTFVRAVLDEHGDPASSVLVGNSLGSVLALRATYQPDVPVSRAVAIAVPMSYRPLLRTVRRSRAALPVLGRLPLPNAVLAPPARFVLRRALYGTRQARDAEVVERFRSQVLDLRSVAALLRRGNQVTDEVFGAVLPELVQRPVTIVHGTRDVFIPTRAAVRLHHALPGSRLVVLPGIGHCPQLDAPNTIAELAA